MHHPRSHPVSLAEHGASGEKRDAGTRHVSFTLAFGILQHCCYNHPSPPSPQPFFPQTDAERCQTPHQTYPAPSRNLLLPAGSAVLHFRSKAKQLDRIFGAGRLFLNKTLRNTLHPDPQASQGLCKHLFFTGLCAISSPCQVSVVPSLSLSRCQEVSYKAEYDRPDNLAWYSYITV